MLMEGFEECSELTLSLFIQVVIEECWCESGVGRPETASYRVTNAEWAYSKKRGQTLLETSSVADSDPSGSNHRFVPVHKNV